MNRVVVEGGEVPGVTSMEEVGVMMAEILVEVSNGAQDAFKRGCQILGHIGEARADCPVSREAIDGYRSKLVMAHQTLGL